LGNYYKPQQRANGSIKVRWSNVGKAGNASDGKWIKSSLDNISPDRIPLLKDTDKTKFLRRDKPTVLFSPIVDRSSPNLVGMYGSMKRR